MRLSVYKSSEKPLPRAITILATIWFKKVGKATINLVNYRYVTYIESYASGKGVAKALCLKVDEVLQEMSNSSGKEIEHKITFLDQNARDRLEPYFQKYGAELGYIPVKEIWYKKYQPRK